MKRTTGATGGTRAVPPPEFRTFAALLLLIVMVGAWLSLHTELAPAAILPPLLGIATAGWAVLPASTKEYLRTQLAERLRKPAVFRAVLLLVALALVGSGFYSSVFLRTSDPEVSTTVSVVRGSQLHPDPAALKEATQVRLNRVTTPTHRRFWISPLGTRVWLYSPVHVSLKDYTMWPWLPAKLVYPDDFARMVTVAILPDPDLMPDLVHRDMTLVVREQSAEGGLLGADTLDQNGFLLSFTDPGSPTSADTARWHGWLTQNRPGAGDKAVARILGLWHATKWIRAVRSLVRGDVVYWEVRAGADSVAGRGTLVLADVVTDLHVAF